MNEALCLMFPIDGLNCTEAVSLTPGGPLCYAHQRELWRIEHR